MLSTHRTSLSTHHQHPSHISTQHPAPITSHCPEISSRHKYVTTVQTSRLPIAGDRRGSGVVIIRHSV